MTQEQQLRSEVLLQLYGSRPLAVGVAVLQRTAQRAGIEASRIAILREAEFLAGQNLAERIVNPVTGETTYRITATGVITYEREVSAL